MKLVFRNSDSIYEIIHIIQRSTEANTFLWQNKNGKRQVYQVKSLHYDEDHHLVQFYLKNYDFALMVDDLIYVKLSYNESLFKGQIVAIENNLISIYLPQEVKTLELRQNKRTSFLPKDEKKVYMDVAQEIGSDRNYHLAFTALDISMGGISVIVSDNNKSMMESSGKHLLTGLGNIKLEEPVLMDLRYSQTLRYRIRGKTHMANRFGFKFLGPVSAAIIDQFIRIG